MTREGRRVRAGQGGQTGERREIVVLFIYRGLMSGFHAGFT